MAEEENAEATAEEIYKPSYSTGLRKIARILIAIALALLGLLIMSVIAYYIALTAATQQYKEVASIAVVKPPPPTENFNFAEDFRVNTTDADRARFVQLKLSLGFESGDTALSTEIAQRLPQLRNIVNLILAAKSSQEISSVEGRLELQEEIKASINHVLSKGKILEIYFKELLVN